MEGAISPRGSLPFRMENPFALKVGQVFTGFGVGCGIGIGVGRPIYLGNALSQLFQLHPSVALSFQINMVSFLFESNDEGNLPNKDRKYPCAIPALQQVLSATRGATDAFSGAARHVNGSLKKLGMKNIEAGIGCGVGIGHGFGADGYEINLTSDTAERHIMSPSCGTTAGGIALKPGVINRIQLSIGQVMAKIMMNLGAMPGLPSALTGPGSVQSSMNMSSGTSSTNVQYSVGSVLDLESKTTGSTFQHSTSNESPHQESAQKSYEPKGTLSEKSIGGQTEKVINNFLQNPLFSNGNGVELNESAGSLRTENNVLQMLLKHQQVIEELMEENQKLRQILMEDLKVPPSKLQAINESKNKAYYPCSNCFECRRRKRKAAP